MEKNRPSLTASKTAMMRAAHQLFDHPIVFKDPLALTILGPGAASDVQSKKRMHKTKLHSHLRAIVVARSRFAEDGLAESVRQGVRQYVILGAGLDTFAFRNPYAGDGLRVFEVDHPATQEWKRIHLDAAGISVPEAVTFVPADFTKPDLAGQMEKAGFRTDKPAFFSWLGVTMYLTRDAMTDTMKFIASSMEPGSGICFDYVIPPSSQSVMHRLVFRLLSGRVARAGEPWKNFLEPVSLMTDLKAMGFNRVQNLEPAGINGRFFRARPDNLRVGGFGHVMTAWL